MTEKMSGSNGAASDMEKVKYDEKVVSVEHVNDNEGNHVIAEAFDPEFEKLLHTNPAKGLTDAEVSERLARFGPNGFLNLTFSYP